MSQREVDLPQLFSDVSRTIHGISSIMGAAGPSQDEPVEGIPSSGSSNGGASMLSGLLGNGCFRYCGAEDVQYAARSAGDMFNTIRTCTIALTVVFLICIVSLTLATLIWFACSRKSPRLPLPNFVKNAFASSQKNVRDDSH